MKDSILMRHILEGLIHNLNTPLNLILGYSHILRKAQPDSMEADNIYQAGIRMDEVLKDLYERISERAFNVSEEVSLHSWLNKELDFLQHYLPIKHGIRFVRKDLCDDISVECSLLELGTWYECMLMRVKELFESSTVQTGITKHEGRFALYIMPGQKLNLEQSGKLCRELSFELNINAKRDISSLWIADQNTLLGIIG